MSSELLQRLYQKRDAKQAQIASLHTELEHLEIAISVVEQEEGRGSYPAPLALSPASNGNGSGTLFLEGDTDQIGPTEVVLRIVKAHADTGIVSGQLVKAVQQQIPGAKPKYIYTVIGRQVNKTKRIKREGKRLFPA